MTVILDADRMVCVRTYFHWKPALAARLAALMSPRDRDCDDKDRRFVIAHPLVGALTERMVRYQEPRIGGPGLQRHPGVIAQSSLPASALVLGDSAIK